jgi:phosphoribosylformylglycinamidine (FGAM) synthase PurS component
MRRAVAINLKIPDNAAYTALVTLRRLGIDVARVERADIVRFADAPDDATALMAAVERDESLYNPNKHRVTVLETDAPRVGEVWIVQDNDDRPVGWRLYRAPDLPADTAMLAQAAERLLCNPAIERTIFPK